MSKVSEWILILSAQANPFVLALQKIICWSVKTKGRKKDKVNIVTLGCSKNIVDSEVILTQLRGNNIDATHESLKDDANIVVINTCGFIDNAKQESIDTILRYVDAKEEGLVEKVYVTGCLSERYRTDLQNEIPKENE